MKPLTIEYSFKDFLQAMNFVNKVAELAEKCDHHPDIEIKYNKVKFSLYTHTTQSVTQKDQDLAEKIRQLHNNA